MSARQALIIHGGDAPRRKVLDTIVLSRLEAAAVEDAFCLMEVVCPPGGGSPPHIHTREDEILVVLEGQIMVDVAGDVRSLSPGCAAVAPRGSYHTFSNRTDRIARFLLAATPGRNIEEFVNSIGVLTSVQSPVPITTPSAQAAIDHAALLAARHGMTFVSTTTDPFDRVNPPTVARPGSGDRRLVVTDILERLVSGARTQNRLVLYVVQVPPGGGPPPHVHHREDETFHVLDGTIDFLLVDHWIPAGPGTTVFGPRDVPHTYSNRTKRPARMLLYVSPSAGAEAFFDELGAPTMLAVPEPVTESPSQEVIGRVLTICEKYGIEILPPS